MHSKGNHKQNAKTIHRMGENICKLSDWHGINLQNIQTVHAAQFLKIQYKKWAEDLNRHLSIEDGWPKKNTWNDAWSLIVR